jgi:YgiT-type zinc finger domain-containing protein
MGPLLDLIEEERSSDILCPNCRHGHLEDGNTTVVLERGDATVVFKNVPARVCENCGEAFVSAAVNADLLQKANRAVDRDVTLELSCYAAGAEPTWLRP